MWRVDEISGISRWYLTSINDGKIIKNIGKIKLFSRVRERYESTEIHHKFAQELEWKTIALFYTQTRFIIIIISAIELWKIQDLIQLCGNFLSSFALDTDFQNDECLSISHSDSFSDSDRIATDLRRREMRIPQKFIYVWFLLLVLALTCMRF